MVDFEPLIADLKAKLILIWPEIVGAGGIIDSEHLTTIPWADMTLPFGVILIDRAPRAGGPLDKLWYQVPVEIYYVLTAAGSAKALRTKLTAAVNGLWTTHPLTLAQVIDIDDPNWSDSLLINQVLRSANRAQRGGRIVAQCLVAEQE